MRSFLQKDGLPSDIKHWQPTVDAMLEDVQTDMPIYLMVDQQFVARGAPHRRPGLHVDGYWNPGVDGHRGTGHGSVSAHGPYPYPGHDSTPSGPPRHYPNRGHNNVSPFPEGLLLASNVQACIGYEGIYEQDFESNWDGGAIKVDVSHMYPTLMKAHRVYAGDVFSVHESVPVPFDCHRTVVRLNVPGWSPLVH